jgi:hypothetical protein
MDPLRTGKLVTTAVAALLCTVSSAIALGQTSAPAAADAPVMEAKIDKTVDTRSAKVNDAVSAKILRSYKLPDGTDLPKGTRVLGKITEVQSKKDGNGNSMLTFRFDTAQVKGKGEVPFHGLVVAIGPTLAAKDVLGPHNVMARSAGGSNDTSDTGRGVGSTPGMDPNSGQHKAGGVDEDDIAMGSTMPGVALGVHKDADWTTALKGFKTDVRLDSDVDIKIQLK